MTGMLAVAGQPDSSSSWLLMGVGLALLIYFAFIKPSMKRKADPLERAPAYASASQQRATERQMQTLLVDLSEMARQISAQLDSRATKLELLIEQADQRLAALGAAGPIVDRPSARMVSTESQGPFDPPAPMLGVRSSPDALPETQADALPPAVQEAMPDPRYADVYRLADEGREPPEIAAELQRPRGEVELILALRGR